jgi:hypothetical protein
MPEMRNFWFLPVLLVTLAGANLALAQASPAAPPILQPRPQTAPASGNDELIALSAAKVPMTAPVITVMGVCETSKTAPAASRAACKTVLTRAEFETLVRSLDPSMSPQTRKQLANAYGGILARAQEARKMGLDKSPEYQEALKFARLQILGQQLSRVMREEANKVSDKEIKDYYEQNQAKFQQANLQRLFVPKMRSFDPVKDNPEDPATKKEAENAMNKEADDLHALAVAGEDFEKLQKDAYEAAHITSPPPSTKQPPMRRGSLPPAQASAFDLKPGEASPVFSDSSGHYIYKMVSKETAPLSEVQADIRSVLQGAHLRDQQQKLRDSTTADLNEDYFGKDTAAPGRPAPIGAGGPMRRSGGGSDVVVPAPRPAPPSPPPTPPQ